MEDSAIITYSGSSSKLFESLKTRLEHGLPKENIEWKRNFGRPSKSVGVNSKFVPLDNVSVLKDPKHITNLLDYPVLHTYWTDCTDVDVYKSFVKDELTNWFSSLRNAYGTSFDWMIILVEVSDARKSSKLLPRTSVLDKIKSEFSLVGKHPERCVCLTDPSKNDSRASESWQTLLHRLRLQILQAYNKILGRFEENMREQREKRNSQNWNFCDYFLLQEQLSFVYEMLGAFDEALVQYDELDALFSQFVLNSNVIDGPYWLANFSNDFSNWSGLSLRTDTTTNKKLRYAIERKSPSLTDVRNYLFSRQSLMLLKMNKPWEVAKRCLTFLHNVVQELNILEVPCPPGSIACWIFLSTLEVVQVCELKSKEALSSNTCDNRKSSTVHVQQYCLYTAELWAYCRKKLLELGDLCGLLPKSNPTSDQLHLVVELIAGINDDYENTLGFVSKKGNMVVSGQDDDAIAGFKTKLVDPAEKLKEALSSKSAFQKCYLELSESAISTYKHIGRLRSARMVGLDLANFYLDLGQVQLAATFLVDALKSFRTDSWSSLQLSTLMQVANCYESLEDHEKLVRCCAEVICYPTLKQPMVTASQRSMYFQRMEEALEKINNPIIIDGKLLLDITSTKIMLKNKLIEPSDKRIANTLTDGLSCKSEQVRSANSNIGEEKVVSGSELILQLDVDSSFPGTIYTSCIKASMNFTEQLFFPTYADDMIDGIKSHRNIHTNNRKQGVRKHVQRSQSTRSNASSVSSDVSCSSYANQSLPFNNNIDMEYKKDVVDLAGTVDPSTECGNERLIEQGSNSSGWVDTLKLREVKDYKQDRNLSAVRLVCRNSAFVLRRKDSTGSMLSSGSSDISTDIIKSDFKYAFTTSATTSNDSQGDELKSSNIIAINPGKNRITLITIAGEIGEYKLNQLSITAFSNKLELLNPFRQSHFGLNPNHTTFHVITRPVMVSLVPYRNAIPTLPDETETLESRGDHILNSESSEHTADAPLWAGICQIVKVSFFTGSCSFPKGTEVAMQCTEGLKGSQVSEVSLFNAELVPQNSLFKVKIPEAAPFTTVTVLLRLHAELGQANSTNHQNHEHCLTFENSWVSSQKPDDSDNVKTDQTTLYLTFLSPFICKGKVQTAFSSKLFNVEIFSTSQGLTLQLKNHRLSPIDETTLQYSVLKNQEDSQNIPPKSLINLVPVQGSDESMYLKKTSACNYLWEIDELPNCTNPGDGTTLQLSSGEEYEGQSDCEIVHRNSIYVKYEVDYWVVDDDIENKPHANNSPYHFVRDFEIKDFQTLYLLKTKVEPNTGGELCRASTICSLSITIEQIKELPPAHIDNIPSVMYEVLTDQSEWAVCGRSAGVMNMDTAKKQTVVVEVMALVGGHLLLPKVKLSKYIPADYHTSHQGHTDEPSPRIHLAMNTSPSDTRSSQAVPKDNNKSVMLTSSNEKTSSVGGPSGGLTSTPRQEPFSPGQVFNVSHLDRVHVLPPAAPITSLNNVAGVGSLSSANPISTLVPTILKSVSRNPSCSSSLQSPYDKDTRKVLRKPSTSISSLSVSSSPPTTSRQPKSLMTIIKGGPKSSVFTSASPSIKSKSTRQQEGPRLTKEEYEQQPLSLP